MSKYAALFNSQSASGKAPTASSPRASSLSNDVDKTNNAVSAGPEASTSAVSASSSPSTSSSSPRDRLVRRRRSGATGSEASNSNNTNFASSEKEDGDKLTVQKEANSTSSAPSASTPATASSSAQPSLTEDNDGASTAPTRARHYSQPQDEVESNLEENTVGVTFEDAEMEGEAPLTSPAHSSQPASSSVASNNSGKGVSANTTTSASSTPSTPHTPVSLYTCDACLHYVASSYHDLERHALTQHGDALADYSRLRAVAEKLVPVWSQVRARKQAVIQQWGAAVFRVANQRDAGAAKMAEAHRARAQLELVVQRWHPNARVFIFGSSVAFGVWDGISDIDFTVVDVAELEAGLWPPSEKNAVRSITELLRRAGFSFINLEPISHARVPIIKHHASLPIRLTDEQRRRLRAEAQRAAGSVNRSSTTSSSNSSSSATPNRSTTASGGLLDDSAAEEEALTSAAQHGGAAALGEADTTQLEAELIIARSVRYTLNLPATALDSAVLEAGVRLAVGTAAVQQVWWNRTRDMCCMTFDTTTNAVAAATCPLHFVTPGMRARVQPLHEECRPELYGMDFDLSFRAFGIRNSHLLRRYLLSHPCARPGALVLKDWSKSSGVNNSVNGYLTSYAINIMWIYYLVHHGVIPYVSPTADIPASLRGNVSGDPEYAAMVDPSWTAAQRAAMEAEAGELLLGFFYYYAFDFDWEHNVVSLNRPGVTTKAQLGWDVEDVAVPMGAIGGGGIDSSANGLFSNNTLQQPPPPPPLSHSQMQAPSVPGNGGSGGGGEQGNAAARRSRTTTRYSFCIEDPYEENLNLGRHMGVTKTLRVQTELYRGLLSLLKDDVRHCCVFAGTAGAEAEPKKTMKRTHPVDPQNTAAGVTEQSNEKGENSEGEPAELPLRVLYRLMAVSTRELALARSAHAAGPSSGDFVGVPLTQMVHAFKTRAPAEWQVATRAWNEHQLLHRLGLKVHGYGAEWMVLPRREVGARRLAAQTPNGVVYAMAPEPTPVPVVNSTSAAAVYDSTNASAVNTFATTAAAGNTAEVAALNQRLLASTRARHLPDDLMVAVTRGYECLTPAWVAWSKPWAALSAWWTDRRQTLGESGSAAEVAAPSSASKDTSTASAPPCPSHRVAGERSHGGDTAQASTGAALAGGSANCPVVPAKRVSTLPEQAVGALHQTRKQLSHVSALERGQLQTQRLSIANTIPTTNAAVAARSDCAAALHSKRSVSCAALRKTPATVSFGGAVASSPSLRRVLRLLFH